MTNEPSPPPVSYWSKQGIFRSPPGTNTIANGHLINAQFLRPLGNIECQSVRGEQNITSPIVGLLFVCHPFAITRFVMAAIINSINGVLRRWFWPHVIIEILKGLAPPLAYYDSTAAVVLIVSAIFVVASSQYPAPSPMLRGVSHTVNLGTIGVAYATTSRRLASCQVRPGDNSLIAAITSAQPRCPVGMIAHVSQYQPAAKAAVSQVLYSFAWNGYNRISHFCTSVADMVRGLEGVRSTAQSSLFYHRVAV
jgi:hypothetical protein